MAEGIGNDEPQILRYAINLMCPLGIDAGQAAGPYVSVEKSAASGRPASGSATKIQFLQSITRSPYENRSNLRPNQFAMRVQKLHKQR